MKLLIYSHFFPPSVGGVETVVLDLARGLAAEKRPDGTPEFELTLVTRTPAGEFRDAELPFQVVREPALLQLRQLVQDAHVVHVAGAAISPILLGFIEQRPLVVEHHGFHVICPNGQLFQEPQNAPCPGHFMAGNHLACLRCSTQTQPMTSLRRWLLTFVRRFLCQRVAVNIAPTAWLDSQLQLPRTERVPHGLPIVAQLPMQTVAGSKPVIGFMGRIVTTKGVGVLLEAARMLDQKQCPFELRIIGDGPERAPLEAQAHKLGLDSQVRFLGKIPQEQVPEILARTDLVVVPSLAGEVFGMVVAENMLRGMAVVASDIGAFREVLENTGLTFETGNAADLAIRLEQLVNDRGRARQLGAAARQRVLDFYTLGRMIRGHAEIYRRLVPEKVS